MPVFTGGLIGYFSYESFKYVEPKLNYKNSDIPLISLCECNELIVFDNFKGTFSIIVNTQNKTLEGFELARKNHGNKKFIIFITTIY